MDVRFVATTSAKLSELSVVNGQLIYISDLNATYYDMGGTRRLMSSMRVVPALPSTSVAQEGVLYGVVNAAGHVDASIWDASASTYRSLSGYVATTSSLGLVKPDGTTITIDANGVISCHAEVTTLPGTAITYDNTTSGLSATNAQAAIDEVNTVAIDAAALATSASSDAQQAEVSAAGAATAAAAAQQNAANASTAAQQAQQAAAAATTAVQAYDTRITGLESTVSGLQSTVVGLSSTVTGMDNVITGLSSSVTSMASTISSFESRLQAVEAVAEIALTTEGATTAVAES